MSRILAALRSRLGRIIAFLGGVSLLLLFSVPFQVAIPSRDFEPQILRIEKGTSLTQLADTLCRRGLITSRTAFVLWARLTGQERRIQAGCYRFVRPLPLDELLRNLKSGGILTVNVTVPEGYTVAQIAELLAERISVNRVDFLGLSHEPSLCRALGIPRPNLEGYLFPDTYNFYEGQPPTEVIRTMVHRFGEVFGDSLQARANQLGFSPDQIVILASIIEGEAGLDNERPLVSAVFHNRIRLGRALESCATVEYVLPKHKERLTLEDIRVSSPYNTYEHVGLPPAPICCPGRKSILAALYPARMDYLYFVSRGDGGHVFSRTAEEHARAKQAIEAQLPASN